MKKWLAIFLLLACHSQAADVVLGKWSDITWLDGGSGKRVASFAAAAPANPVDPWTYAGLWRQFGTNSAGNFIDFSGNNNTGVVSGVTFTEGKYTNQYGQVGSSNYFDGVDDVSTIADSDVLTLTTNGVDAKFTIALQYSLTAKNGTGYDVLLAKDDFDTNNQEEYWLTTELNQMTLWLWDKTSASRNKYVKFSSDAAFFGLLTNRISIVWSYGGNANAEFYSTWNAAAQYTPNTLTNFDTGTSVVNYVSMTNRASPLRVGRLGSSTLYSFKGEIHNVSIIRGTNWTLAEAQTWHNNTIWTNHLYNPITP